jgi:hypothetical protein
LAGFFTAVTTAAAFFAAAFTARFFFAHLFWRAYATRWRASGLTTRLKAGEPQRKPSRSSRREVCSLGRGDGSTPNASSVAIALSMRSSWARRSESFCVSSSAQNDLLSSEHCPCNCCHTKCFGWLYLDDDIPFVLDPSQIVRTVSFRSCP